MSDLIKAVLHEGLHGLTFEYKGIQYDISGYWMIEGFKNAFDLQEEPLPGTSHFYDTKEELIHAKIFEGKSLIEIADDAKILDIFNDWN